LSSRFAIWRGVEEWRAEASRIEIVESGITASGTQISDDPEPYRIDYEIETGEGYVTTSLRVTGGERSLDLRRGADGGWNVDVDGLDDALDCDLAFSPLTNVMPILRHNLHREPGQHDFTMAWVDVPSLTVHASPQRYTHVRPGIVRFESLDSDFVADLELDDDGLVVFYPRLARRL
jgi:hypothetical protein